MSPTDAADANHPDAATARIAPSAAAAESRRWVPIRSLAPRHRHRIADHLIALDAGDRYLRFGYPATDAHIAAYVDALDFARDQLFGIFDRRLDLIAIAHLAHGVDAAAPDPTDPGHAAAEFGVSVRAEARHRGFGRRLFEHAALHARNRGVDRLLIHALSENAAMLAIARTAGADVVRTGSESDAWLTLPPDTFGSHVDAFVEHQAAEFDYGLKRHAHRVHAWFDAAAGDAAGSPRETVAPD